jgi:DNA polymerase-3 subunit delta
VSDAGGAAAPDGALAPITLLVSKDEDQTVLLDAMRAEVDRLLGPEDRSLALEELSGDDLTVGAVVDAAQTPPFLTGRRVIVVREVSRFSSEDLEPLFGYLESPLATTALVLVGGGGKLSQKLVNAAKKYGRLIDATVPSGKGRTGWLADQVRAGPVELDAAASSRLKDHLGEGVGRLPRLLDSLAAAYGEGAKVSAAELEPFLGEAGGVAPWDLTDAIDRGDTDASLLALHRMMAGGERHPMGVLAVLHRHYSAMLRLDGSGATSDAEAAGLVGMAPFPAGKVLKTARRLGSAGVARAITLLAEADLDLRGMKDWPDELVLEVLVGRLSRLGGRAAASSSGGSRTAQSGGGRSSPTGRGRSARPAN